MPTSQFSGAVQTDQAQSMGGASVGASPLGDIIYVDSSAGNDGNDGESRQHALLTLTRALAIAGDGDTIITNPGGSETITSGLSSSLDNIRIVCPVDDPENGFAITGAGTLDLLTLSGDGVSCDGIKFAHTGATASASCVLLASGADNNSFHKCLFDDSAITTTFGGAGIEVTNESQKLLVDSSCKFKDCKYGVLFATATGKNQYGATIKDSTFYVGQAAAWGVHASPTGTGEVRGLVIDNNVFLEAAGDGDDAAAAWDGSTQGPILFGAGVQQAMVRNNAAYSASASTFEGLCSIDASATVTQIANECGEAGAPAIAVTGTADCDVSAADYTGWVNLLEIAPGSGSPLKDVRVVIDLDKETTGWADVGTSETISFAVGRKVDGTSWRVDNTTATTGIAASAADGMCVSLDVGTIDATGAARIYVTMSAETGSDVELPYRVLYSGTTPTITPVAAA